jgi:hypothetical protein
MLFNYLPDKSLQKMQHNKYSTVIVLFRTVHCLLRMSLISLHPTPVVLLVEC